MVLVLVLVMVSQQWLDQVANLVGGLKPHTLIWWKILREGFAEAGFSLEGTFEPGHHDFHHGTHYCDNEHDEEKEDEDEDDDDLW